MAIEENLYWLNFYTIIGDPIIIMKEDKDHNKDNKVWIIMKSDHLQKYNISLKMNGMKKVENVQYVWEIMKNVKE